MSFLAPLFLAGLGLLALPILIHRIRRPEKEIKPFSSLMFVPKVPKEVIERRKIQHLLLLLLRMLLLLLLVFAFSRPFKNREQQAVFNDETSVKHLILVDTSLSMKMGNRMKEAVDQVAAISAKIPNGDSLGLASFDHRGVLIKDIQPNQVSAVREAARQLKANDHKGDYFVGLRFAESVLKPNADTEQMAVLHLVSDFQQTVIETVGARLSGRVLFQGYRVGGQDLHNLSITEAEVRQLAGQELQIATKVKYWQGQDPVQVSLRFKPNSAAIETPPPISLVLEPGGASLGVFQIPWNGTDPVTGVLELAEDGLAEDNRFFLHWVPDPSKPLMLVTNTKAPAVGAAAWFVEKAIAAGAGTQWDLSIMTHGQWQEAFDSGAALPTTVWLDHPDATDAQRNAFLQFIQHGGNGLAMIHEQSDDHGFEPAGIRTNSSQKSEPLEAWTWVAFQHPVFAPFGSAKFNDFSPIHFLKTRSLELTASTASPLGKTAQSTVMAEVIHGRGQLIVWGFQPQLNVTNLPKHIKFVPILQETLQYLTRDQKGNPQWFTGAGRASVMAQAPANTDMLQLPDGRTWREQTNAAKSETLQSAGWIQRQAVGSQNPQIWGTVNIPAQEGNPGQMDVAEFALRLTSSKLTGLDTNPDNDTETAALGVRQEFGYGLLLAIAVFLALETWLAFRLSRSAPKLAMEARS